MTEWAVAGVTHTFDAHCDVTRRVNSPSVGERHDGTASTRNAISFPAPVDFVSHGTATVGRSVKHCQRLLPVTFIVPTVTTFVPSAARRCGPLHEDS